MFGLMPVVPMVLISSSANGRGFARNAKTEQANDQSLFSAVGSEWQAEGIGPGGQFNQLGKGCGRCCPGVASHDGRALFCGRDGDLSYIPEENTSSFMPPETGNANVVTKSPEDYP